MEAPGSVDGKEQGRRFGMREGALCAVMQGGGESYLSAFALLLHATPFQIGLLVGLPQIIGTWSQLISLKILAKFRERKPIILAGITGQALAFLPLFLLPLLFPGYGAWLVIAGAVVYFGMGHMTIPAWNSLLTDLIDEHGRGAYYAQRAKVVALVSFITLSIAAVILHATEGSERAWLGFGLVFFVAAVARLASTRYVARVEDRPHHALPAVATGVCEFIRHERSSDFRRFLLFSGGMHVSAAISGPFFAVYLLQDLHLTYIQYGVWMAAPILGQLMTLGEWGRIGDMFGNKKVLTVTGLMVPFLPMLYILSTDWVTLSVVNFMAGVTWSGLSLSLGNYVFDTVSAADRPKGVAVYNTVNAVSLGIGAMLGSWIASTAPASMALPGLAFTFVSNLPVVFFVSGIFRLIVALTLLRTFQESRTVTAIRHRDLVHELPLIKPFSTAFARPRRAAIAWAKSGPSSVRSKV